MYEKILVPLDGSDAAEIVLPYVVEIATKLSTEITLVSVSEISAAGVDRLYQSYMERITEQVKQQLKDWGATGEVRVHSEILLGRPANEILRLAGESNVSLIAMASRGSSGQGPWLLGNITAEILRAASQSVLITRISADSAALQQKRLVKRILVPLDGSTVGEAAIPCAEVLARALGSELVLFQVMEPIIIWAGFEGSVSYATPQDEENRKASIIAYLTSVAKPLKESGIGTSIAVGFGSSADQIIDYAEANTIDLIAMSSHGRSGIGRWVFGSVTSKVLRAGDTPVLIVRATKV